jgi:hypothetical protein
MLKLGAINFHDRVRFAEQNLCCGFDDARFPRTGRSEEKHRADGRAGLFIPAR